MKLPLFFLSYLFATCQLLAQNVGIGTNTPHNSALLDVSSNNKGMLAPRMTTAQRNAIASPAKGLLVYDTDLNSLYHFNGAGWAAVGAGGGGFTLPFEGAVNLSIPGIKITNAGLGPAIQAITTNDYGIGLAAYNTSDYGYSVYAYSRSPNAVSLYGIADSAIAVKAQSDKGIGLDAISTDSTAIRARIIKGLNEDPVILATHAGFGPGVSASSQHYSAIVGTTSTAAFTRAGVAGINNGTAGSGVYGEANVQGGYGVQGSSINGSGVKGYSSYYRGVAGEANTGTAIWGSSSNGYGLEVSGKLRLYGGNTAPQAGAVLTSVDGLGNAVWKPAYKIGFKAYAPYAALLGFPDNVSNRKLHFGSEAFDYNGNFTPTTSSSPTAFMSTFEVPVSGLYHFDVGAKAKLDDTYDDFEVCYIYIKLIRNGVDYELGHITTECCNANLGYEVGLYGSTDVDLLAGDRVYLTFYQRNDDSAVGKLVGGMETYFNGHLVFAK